MRSAQRRAVVSGRIAIAAAVVLALGSASLISVTPALTGADRAAAQPGSTTRYYFHSQSGLSNQFDRLAFAGATFDTLLPEWQPGEHSMSTDTAIVTQTAPGAIYDPTWQGSIASPFTRLTVDFWHEIFVGASATTPVTYDFHLFVDVSPNHQRFELPRITVPPPTSPTRVVHTFTTMLDSAGNEVPLSINPNGKLITIAYNGGLLDGDDGLGRNVTTVYLDSVEYPSGFEVSSGGSTVSPTPTSSASTSPSPSVSPSPTPTIDPDCPAAGRGSYPETPNDPFFPDLPYDPENPANIYAAQQWGPQHVKAPQAWQEANATGWGINVAVIDSGVDLDHPELKCKIVIVPGADAVGDKDGPDTVPDDIDGHGTHVAGTIGAQTHNGEGIAGVAPDATIMPIQVFTAAGGVVEDINKGIRAAADGGAHVINMSLSVGAGALPVGGGVVGYVPGLFAETDAAIEYAQSKGVVVIAAAGNDSLPLCEYPALAENVVCVGATDKRDVKTWYSGFPVKFDNEDMWGAAVVAPGGQDPDVFCDLTNSPDEGIYSTVPPDLQCSEFIEEGPDETHPGYQVNFGTSMASPHVAGVAALVYDRLGGVRSQANALAIIDILKTTSYDLGDHGYDPVFGFGLVDAQAAVRAVDDAVCTIVAGVAKLDVPSGGPLTVASAGGALLTSPVSACNGTSLSSLDRLVITGSTGDETLTLDLAGGGFAPGVEPETVPEVEIDVALGDGSDSLTIDGAAIADSIELGSTGANLNGDGDGDDLTHSGVEAFVLNGGAGDDSLSAAGGLLTGAALEQGVTFDGGDGRDLLAPGAGPDLVQGGGGHDTVSYETSPAPLALDLSQKTVSGGYARGDTLKEISSAVGTQHADSMTGNGLQNVFAGGAGSDVIKGLGNIDSIRGGPGTDVLDGGAGRDTVDFSDVDTGFSIDLSLTPQTAVGSLPDTSDSIAGFESVIGSSGNDSIVGDGDHNYLYGGPGDDTLIGKAGNDTLNGGAGADAIDGKAGSDTVDYSGSPAGVTVDLSTLTASGGHADGDVLLNVIWATGSDHADTLIGSRINNLLAGGAGDDALFGLDGNDTLRGGEGIDALHGGSGTDRCQDGESLDSCEA